MIFLRLFKKIGCFFDRIEHDVRLFSLKPSLILGGISLCLGIFSWLIGGSTDRALLMLLFPRSAISVGFMFFLWGVSFAFIGIVIGGVIFGCEKYKRKDALKTTVFIVLSFIITLCIHPMFFRSIAPFFTCLLLLVSLIFCILAIISALRLYSLWSLCLMAHSLWIFYNCYLCFAIAIIN